MPRELCIGNGRLLLNFDKDLSIRDLYFPHVGLENHVSGYSCKIGVWVDGIFSWIDESWKKSFGYRGDTLVAETLLKRPDLDLELRVEDSVHPQHDIFLRRVTVRNGAEEDREVRLFFSQDLHIWDTDDGITAYYDPRIDSLIHYKKDRYFMIGGSGEGGGLFEFSIAGSDTSRSN
ncbi:MAG TPA: hypothetical protein VE134_01160, partial [Methanomicrobiales archaeon]|nr:hypothetical protein [Methanomicrobiales archaeon]